MARAIAHDQLDAYLSSWVASLAEHERIAFGRPPDDAIWVPQLQAMPSRTSSDERAGLDIGSVILENIGWVVGNIAFDIAADVMLHLATAWVPIVGWIVQDRHTGGSTVTPLIPSSTLEGNTGRITFV